MGEGREEVTDLVSYKCDDYLSHKRGSLEKDTQTCNKGWLPIARVRGVVGSTVNKKVCNDQPMAKTHHCHTAQHNKPKVKHHFIFYFIF